MTISNLRRELDNIDAEDIEIELRVTKSYMDGGVDILRAFYGTVLHIGPDDTVEIGSIDGLLAWNIFGVDVEDAADAISADAYMLGSAAQEIIDADEGRYLDVILIERMFLNPEIRGQRLSGAIITRLLDLLQLDRGSTVVVLQPEPQKPEGGYMDDGAERDSALQHLTDAYRVSGLEPWDDSTIWWLPPNEV